MGKHYLLRTSWHRQMEEHNNYTTHLNYTPAPYFAGWVDPEIIFYLWSNTRPPTLIGPANESQ